MWAPAPAGYGSSPNGADPPLVDRVDLLAFRDRWRFAGLVADVLGRQRGDVLGALTVVLDAIERASAIPPPSGTDELTPERRRAAEALLAAPDLLDRAEAGAGSSPPTRKKPTK